MSAYTTTDTAEGLLGWGASQIILHRYSLPNVNGCGWAIVTIGSDGTFSAISDWGHWSHWWQGIGEVDARAFVLDTDDRYLVEKLASEHGRDPLRCEAFAHHVMGRLRPILRAELAAEITL